jgi:hypothetical protein
MPWYADTQAAYCHMFGMTFAYRLPVSVAMMDQQLLFKMSPRLQLAEDAITKTCGPCQDNVNSVV